MPDKALDQADGHSLFTATPLSPYRVNPDACRQMNAEITGIVKSAQAHEAERQKQMGWPHRIQCLHQELPIRGAKPAAKKPLSGGPQQQG